ncbi:MAG: ferrous iron transporter B [Halobacteriovoraceae bacterium]|nr:ferrous iron transporter B [Halobacteriovoraceae bacterium]|tara:strand:+ start:9987 stop:11846 length:1860 start_codon:yes stop_codon:yes gene_type:complete
MSLIALVGLPNSGKSSLFNTLTGNRQRVANFPGITVEKKLGELTFNNQNMEVIDLPGVYTLDASTLDEKITRDYIFNKTQANAADVYVLVMDATNIKKSLYLAFQLKELGKKFVVALNMMDIASQRGQVLDVEALSNKLGGAPVVPTVAVAGEGVSQLLSSVEKMIKIEEQKFEAPSDYQLKIKTREYIKEKLSLVEQTLDEVILTKIKADTFTEKLDSFVLHPILGPILLLSILVVIFQLLFAWSDPFMGMIEMGFEWLGAQAILLLPAGYLQSLVVDGIIAGVGGILVFLPHIIFLFIIIYFLEDFGYLGRAAFLLDFTMRRLGLPGKAVVPLLSSHACAIPGIMSARIIENPTQRLITMMISPLTTCSARLPVYTLLIAAIIPNITVLGFLQLPGLVLFGLYLFGILGAFGVAFFAKKTFLPTSPSYLMMELPAYRVPKVWTVLRGALQKGWIFVKKAGTVIFLLSIIIWGLVTFPGAPENASEPDINYSYAAQVGKTFEPLFRPLGFDWKITTALIPSFAAREVLVASMGTVYAVEGEDTESESFLASLTSTLNKNYSLATLLALLMWFVFAPQCIATFGVLKKETNSYKMPLVFGAYTLAMAYVFSFLTFVIFS